MFYLVYRKIGPGFLIILNFLLQSCYKEIEFYSYSAVPVLKFNNTQIAIDKPSGRFLLSFDQQSMYEDAVIYANVRSLHIEGDEYFEGNRIDLSGYRTGDSVWISFYTPDNEYMEGYLHFTTLPVVRLFCDDNIPDEPKIPCDFILTYHSNGKGYSLESKAGIEQRGRASGSYPKKSYAIELWEDQYGVHTRDESLLGMRSDDDWILDAMYVDKSRMRNKISMEIWRDIYARSENPLSLGKAYTESHFVEVFLNMEYIGLYCLTERIDRKQLEVEVYDYTFRGLLYKSEIWTSTTKFIDLADTTKSCYWDGWEQKYPDPETLNYWRPIYDFTSFVINADEQEFEAEVYNYLDPVNLTDYFIFVNLCQAFDNMGTNMFYARYSTGDPFIILPWDLDATWGQSWDATLLKPVYWLDNKYYRRIFTDDIGNIQKRILDRWVFLRQGICRGDDLKRRFIMNFRQLERSGAIIREANRWPETNLDLHAEMDYIFDWIDNRLLYLDNQISSLKLLDWENMPFATR